MQRASLFFLYFTGLNSRIKLMRTLTYRILLQPEPEGGFTVLVPSLAGCVTFGETVDEAIQNAREAIEGCLEVYREKGVEVSDDSRTLEYSLNLEVA